MTVNLGNYESAKVSVGLESDVEEGETWESALERVRVFVKHTCEKEAERVADGSLKKTNFS
jgi:hypothetical protein